MREIAETMTEITQLTSNIQTNYPELYRFVDENPLTLQPDGRPSINKLVLAEYLDTLKTMLRRRLKQHTQGQDRIHHSAES